MSACTPGRLLAALLVLACPDAPCAQAPARIALGTPVRGTLGPDDPMRAGRGPVEHYELLAISDGSVTITLDSVDFDAIVVVETTAGECVAEADGGGIGTNARLVLALAKGRTYRVLAMAAKNEGGAYDLAVAAGDVPQLAGAPLLEAELAFRRVAAERALARSDRRAAAEHLLEEAQRLHAASRFAAAQVAYERRLMVVRELGDRRLEAQAVGSVAVMSLALGDYGAAQQYAAEQLELAREVGDGASEMSALGRLATAGIALGEYPSARELATEHATLARRAADAREEARALLNLGNVAVREGDLPRADEHYAASLRLARTSGRRADLAAPLGNLGAIAFALGDHEKARACYEEDLAIQRETANRAGEVVALTMLGNALDAGGDSAAARARYEAAVDLAQSIGDRHGEANARSCLAAHVCDLGDHAAARDHAERQIELARATRCPEVEAQGLASSTLYLWFLGELEQARARGEEALALARQLGHRASEAAALHGLCNVHRSLGDLAQARASAERHLDLQRELGSLTGEASACTDLGLVHAALGDHRQAREWHQASLAFHRRRGASAGLAGSLVNLAEAHHALGDYERARDLHAEGLAMASAVSQRKWQGNALAGLGLAWVGLRNYAAARAPLEQALALARDTDDRVGEATCLASLAAVQRAAGEAASAGQLAAAALALQRHLGLEDATLGPLAVLAAGAIGDGDLAAARTLMDEAAPLLERALGRGRNDAAALAEWSELGQDLAAACARTDAPRTSRAAALGFEWAGRWQSRALLAGIAEHRRGGRTAQAIGLGRDRRELLARRATLLMRVSTMVRAGEPSAAVDAVRNEASELLAAADRLATAVHDASPREAALDLPSGVDVSSVRHVLPGDALLVQFAAGSERLYAYALRGTQLTFLDLGDRWELEGSIEEYLSHVGSLDLRTSAAAVAELGGALFDRLLAAALRAAGAGVRQLVIVPSAGLASLPFEALVIGGRAASRSFADIEFVLDRYDVSYAPSVPVLVELASAAARRGDRRVLVLADPCYPSEVASVGHAAPVEPRGEAEPRRMGPAPSRLTRLARSRQEAFAIAALLAPSPGETPVARAQLVDQRSGSLVTPAFALHLGQEASPRRLIGDLTRWSVLHIAAHGYVDRELPQRTGIALAFEVAVPGYFTIADALELDLDADLVVLSGCETTRGDTRAGAGLESMARAFLYAGARAVVASLWQVEDRTTAETMATFYQGVFEAGLAAPRALREAKLAVRRSSQTHPGAGIMVESGHPFFWAPFIHIGLPR